MRSTICSLGLYPTTTTNASLIPTNPPQHISLEKNRGSWRRPSVVIGVASCFTIIGLQFNNSLTIVPMEEIMFTAMSNSSSSTTVVLAGGLAKWSQKRTCPSWHGNNPLETIVPENLPCPAARRRYEAVRSNSKTAPSLSVSVKINNNRDNCFSM